MRRKVLNTLEVFILHGKAGESENIIQFMAKSSNKYQISAELDHKSIVNDLVIFASEGPLHIIQW
jgi:hypothetical protein